MKIVNSAFSRVPFFLSLITFFCLPLSFFFEHGGILMNALEVVRFPRFDEITDFFHRVENFHSDAHETGKNEREPFRPREVFRRDDRTLAARDEDDETLQSSVVCVAI